MDEYSLPFMQGFQQSESDEEVSRWIGLHQAEFKWNKSIFSTTRCNKDNSDIAHILPTPDLWLWLCSSQQENK